MDKYVNIICNLSISLTYSLTQGDSPKVAVYLSDGTLQYNHGT